MYYLTQLIYYLETSTNWRFSLLFPWSFINTGSGLFKALIRTKYKICKSYLNCHWKYIFTETNLGNVF